MGRFKHGEPERNEKCTEHWNKAKQARSIRHFHDAISLARAMTEE
jgi:hypothetical protein